MQSTSLFVDDLTVIDFSYLHPTRGLLGESWIVDVELLGELDDKGFIFDFSLVKQKIKSVLDELIDHTLLVPKFYKDLNFTIEENRINLIYKCKSGKIEMKAPLSAVYLADVSEITIPTVTPLLEKEILKNLPDNVLDVKLNLHTEKIDTPFYHYSHGLKKHDGNCQRIAHGHRSKIEIYINGDLSKKWMSYWTDKFADIYIASSEDVIRMNDDNISFEYRSLQGDFSLTIPSSRCYIINTETTVEEIARHIGKIIHEKQEADHIIVRAFEGVKKGSIVRYESS